MPKIQETDHLEDMNPIAGDRHEPLMVEKEILTESIADTEENRFEEVESSVSSLGRPSPLGITREISRTTTEGSESDLLLHRPDTPSLRPQTKAPESISVQKELKIEMESFSEQLMTAPLPPVHTFPSLPTELLEDLPALPPSEPSSRPGTPEFVADPPGESPSLTPPENRSNAKVDVGYLRLPLGISRFLSGDRDLPLPSPDPSADSGYAGVSLQSGPDIPSLLPESRNSGHVTSANVPQPSDDLEDEDPSLSLFRDRAQAVSVPQVGLRSPMFPGASGFRQLLGTINFSTPHLVSQPSGDPEDEDPSLSSFVDGAQAISVAQVGLHSPMFPGASGFGHLSGTVDLSPRDSGDEDPSLSPFGDGTIQVAPAAQVGLHSPTFPGASGFGHLLGAADSSAQRFFPQQGGTDTDDKPAHDSITLKNDNQCRSPPSIEIDAPAENGGKESEEGWTSLS